MKKIESACVAVVVAATLTAWGSAGTNGSNPVIAGVIGPTVEFLNGNILLSMTIQSVSMDAGATIPIPSYPNSSLQVGPDFQSNGTIVVLTISAADFVKGKGLALPATQLPDGRPLPSVAAGSLPAVALRVPAFLNAVFYVGPDVIGFFLPVKLGLSGAILTFRFFDNTSKPIGLISLVGKAAGTTQQDGILAMMRADLLGIIPGLNNPTIPVSLK